MPRLSVLASSSEPPAFESSFGLSAEVPRLCARAHEGDRWTSPESSGILFCFLPTPLKTTWSRRGDPRARRIR